jgi:hypothetical protein
MLRRSHDRHRDLPARLRAAHPAGDISNRDQDRNLMINSVSPRHPSGQFCFAGSRPAMTMLALASPRIATSFNLRRLTPVLTYRDRSTKPFRLTDRFRKRRSTHVSYIPPLPKFP